MGNFAWVLDVMLLLIILGITYAVGSEGLFGAAVMFVNVMFAGLIAFSLYEPISRSIAPSVGQVDVMVDFITLVILFGVAFTLIRLATDFVAPWYVRFHGAVDQVGRYVFGFATGWYFVGMLLCVVETAPVHKMFMGYQWKTHALWNMGIDRFWLGFAQATTDRYFEWDVQRPPGAMNPRAFDPHSDFIIRYHKWRPFGDPDPTMPGAGAAPAQGAQPGGAGGGQPAAGGGGGGAGGGRPPLDPTGATQTGNF